MSFFSKYKSGSTLTATDTGELVSARQAYVDATRADMDRARETYHEYLNAAAMVGLEVGTPEVRKHEQTLAEAEQRHKRAVSALNAAEAEAERAKGREHDADEAKRWEKIESLVAAREKAAKAYGAAIAEAAALQRKFQEANVELFRAIPAAAPVWVRDVISKGLALATLEVRRVGLVPLYAGETLSSIKPFADVIAEARTLFSHMRAGTGAFAPRIAEQPEPETEENE